MRRRFAERRWCAKKLVDNDTDEVYRRDMRSHLLVWVLGAIVVAVVAGAAVCGSGTPTARTPTAPAKAFVFTPVPYKYVPLAGTPVPIAGLSTKPCAPFVADEVLVMVAATDIEQFDAWSDMMGFSRETERLTATGDRYSIVLGVPLGSVPAAISAAREAPGVLDVGQNGFAFADSPRGSGEAFCATFGPDP
jgi:hypothetical protein